MRKHLKLLVALCMTSFLTSFMGSSLNIAMPFIAQDYDCSPENVTWMINAFTASSAAFLLASSALANRFGYLNIFLTGALSSGILSFAVTLAPELISGSLIRGIQGVALSLVFCTAMALISQRVEREYRSFAIAYNVSSVYAGLTLSPLISGLIVDTLGWRTMFYITTVGLIASFFLTYREPKDKPITDKMPLGRMLASFAIGLIILIALSGYTSYSYFIYILLIGIVALGVYLGVEYRSKKPLLPLKFIWSNNVLKYALFASTFHYLASFVFTLLIAMHLQLILGYAAATTGMILMVQPFLMVLFSTLSGKLSHMVGPQYLTITGMTLCLLGVVTLFWLTPDSSLTLIFAAQVLLGVGFGLFSAPNTVIVMSSVEPHQYAMASAVQSISRTVGQATSMAILTALLHYTISATVGTSAYISELSGAIHLSLTISSCSYGVGLIFCLLCLKNRIAVVRARRAAEATEKAASAQPATPTAESAQPAKSEPTIAAAHPAETTPQAQINQKAARAQATTKDASTAGAQATVSAHTSADSSTDPAHQAESTNQ